MPTGRKPSTIKSVIETAVNGQTVAGTNLSITFNPADNPLDPTAGPIECADGGFVVIARGGSTVGMDASSSSGGKVQRKWNYDFTLRFAYRTDACLPQYITADWLVIVEKTIDLVEAAAEPQAAGTANYTIRSVAFNEPREAANGGMYVQEIRFGFQEFWARS